MSRVAPALSLEHLAGIWVDRWLKSGGGVILDRNCDSISLSMGMDSSERWRSRHPTQHQRHWHNGWTVGRWRELNDLAREIPGLREAIIEHVAVHGNTDASGRTWMSAPHPWDNAKDAA